MWKLIKNKVGEIVLKHVKITKSRPGMSTSYKHIEKSIKEITNFLVIILLGKISYEYLYFYVHDYTSMILEIFVDNTNKNICIPI